MPTNDLFSFRWSYHQTENWSERKKPKKRFRRSSWSKFKNLDYVKKTLRFYLKQKSIGLLFIRIIRFIALKLVAIFIQLLIKMCWRPMPKLFIIMAIIHVPTNIATILGIPRWVIELKFALWFVEMISYQIVWKPLSRKIWIYTTRCTQWIPRVNSHSNVRSKIVILVLIDRVI